MTTTEVENYPGFRDGIMGPELMDEMREQALRFGADLRMEDVDAVAWTAESRRSTVGGEIHRARAVILAMGAAARYLGVPARSSAARPRRQHLCDLRRVLLPRPGHRRHRRRRLRDGGGHLPHQVRAAASP